MTMPKKASEQKEPEPTVDELKADLAEERAARKNAERTARYWQAKATHLGKAFNAYVESESTAAAGQ